MSWQRSFVVNILCSVLLALPALLLGAPTWVGAVVMAIVYAVFVASDRVEAAIRKGATP